MKLWCCTLFLEPVREAVRSTADHYRCVERSTTWPHLLFRPCYIFTFSLFRPISPYLRESRSLRMALTSSIIPTLAYSPPVFHQYFITLALIPPVVHHFGAILHHFGPTTSNSSVPPLWHHQPGHSPPLNECHELPLEHCTTVA